MSITALPSGRYRVQIRKRSLKFDQLFDTRKEAERAEAEALARAQPPDQDIKVRSLWARYVDSQLFGDKTENTRRTERTRIQPILEHLGNYTLGELEKSPGVIYDYMDMRRKHISPRTKKKLSGTSVRLEIAALSSVVEFAKKRRLVHENFVSRISRPASGRRNRRISNEEQGSLSIHSRSEHETLARAARFGLLVRHLGCRPGELCALLISQVRLERQEVYFPETKNEEDRAAHLTKDARELIHLQLETVPEGCPYLFWSVSRSGEFTPYGYASGVRLLRRKGVVESDYHSHAGRREFVSRGIEAGVPLTTLKKQSGHKSTQALEIYDNGLSTAPEIRAQLDRLADTVQLENLVGAMAAVGMTPEQRQAFLTKIGKGGEVTFEQAALEKSRR